MAVKVRVFMVNCRMYFSLYLNDKAKHAQDALLQHYKLLDQQIERGQGKSLILQKN